MIKGNKTAFVYTDMWRSDKKSLPDDIHIDNINNECVYNRRGNVVIKVTPSSIQINGP